MGMTALLIAGVFEVIMVYCLNKAAGFKNKFWGVLVIIFAFCSLIFLSIGMETLEAGIAYSIWVAMGSIGSLLLGVVVFKDKLNWQQVLCIVGIIIAVVGLKSA